MKPLHTLLLTAATLGSLTLTSARAGEVYANFTLGGGAGPAGLSFGEGIGELGAFTPAFEVRLDMVEIVVAGPSVAESTFAGAIHADAGGLPGAQLESLGLMRPTGSEPATGFSAVSLLLEPGQMYWLVLSDSPSHVTYATWLQNALGVQGTAENTGTWATLAADQGAMRLVGAPVSTLHGNLAPTGTHQASLSYAVQGSGVGTSQSVATSFTAVSDAPFSSVTLGLTSIGAIDDVQIALHDDLAGEPGALVEDLGTHSGFATWGSTNQALTKIVSTALPVLSAGSTYWVVCSPADPATDVRWAWNDKGLSSTMGTQSGGSWTIASAAEPALQVDAMLGAPVNYCTAGVSAIGCQATLSTFGTPCLNSEDVFVVIVKGHEAQKDGVFFYGFNGRQANAWGSSSSFQCVTPPVTRTPLETGNGTAGTCGGSEFVDLNELWTQQPQKSPAAGAVVQVQFWYRDPFNTSNQTTSLSDALEFTVYP